MANASPPCARPLQSWPSSKPGENQQHGASLFRRFWSPPRGRVANCELRRGPWERTGPHASIANRHADPQTPCVRPKAPVSPGIAPRGLLGTSYVRGLRERSPFRITARSPPPRPCAHSGGDKDISPQATEKVPFLVEGARGAGARLHAAVHGGRTPACMLRMWS